MPEKKEFNKLKVSPEYGGLVGEVPFTKYPRPQLKRDSFFNLNGKWDCGVVVPFPLIGCTNYSYYTTFSLPANFIKDRVLLNFGAVDQIATVFIDGKKVGEHEGGYTPFSFDITDFLSAENPHKIQVDVVDTLDHKYPYGKQKKNRGGMWYTPVSGIWQTVWIESVPASYIRGLKITPDLQGIKLEIDGNDEEYKIEIKARTIPGHQ